MKVFVVYCVDYIWGVFSSQELANAALNQLRLTVSAKDSENVFVTEHEVDEDVGLVSRPYWYCRLGVDSGMVMEFSGKTMARPGEETADDWKFRLGREYASAWATSYISQQHARELAEQRKKEIISRRDQ